MPELPEVEVTKRGIEPHIVNRKIIKISVHNPHLRWPVKDDVRNGEHQFIESVTRRAKYLFVNTKVGSLMLHLGMSGNMRVIDSKTTRKKHDHIEIELDSGFKLVFNDARRFGSCFWQGIQEEPHILISKLGPEPLSSLFHNQLLYEKSRGKTVSVKNFIMDNAIVVGVGNIYANEALFKSGIDPRRQAGKISLRRYKSLTENIKNVLSAAIEQGGTTLRDFTRVDGSPGYFAQKLLVYGRASQPCFICREPIKSKIIGQRNTFYCIKCQK